MTLPDRALRETLPRTMLVRCIPGKKSAPWICEPQPQRGNQNNEPGTGIVGTILKTMVITRPLLCVNYEGRDDQADPCTAHHKYQRKRREKTAAPPKGTLNQPVAMIHQDNKAFTDEITTSGE